MIDTRPQRIAPHRCLSAADFRTPPRSSPSEAPLTIKLAGLMAKGMAESLTAAVGSQWRVALDQIKVGPAKPWGASARWFRFESRAGSMTIHICIDKAAVSALCESAMGGTGSEIPYEIPERPLSSIEGGIAALVKLALARGLAPILSKQFSSPVNLFEDAPDLEEAGSAEEMLAFCYLVNVFGYSGEIRIGVKVEELESQLNVAAGPALEYPDAGKRKSSLQNEVGKAGIDILVCLAPQEMPVGAISSLTPGYMLKLSSSATGPVLVSSGGSQLYTGLLARSGEHLAVRIIALLA